MKTRPGPEDTTDSIDEFETCAMCPKMANCRIPWLVTVRKTLYTHITVTTPAIKHVMVLTIQVIIASLKGTCFSIVELLRLSIFTYSSCIWTYCRNRALVERQYRCCKRKKFVLHHLSMDQTSTADPNQEWCSKEGLAQRLLEWLLEQVELKESRMGRGQWTKWSVFKLS